MKLNNETYLLRSSRMNLVIAAIALIFFGAAGPIFYLLSNPNAFSEPERFLMGLAFFLPGLIIAAFILYRDYNQIWYNLEGMILISFLNTRSYDWQSLLEIEIYYQGKPGFQTGPFGRAGTLKVEIRTTENESDRIRFTNMYPDQCEDFVGYVMEKHGILLRKMNPIKGRKGLFRITIGNNEENKKCVDAVKDFFEKRKG